MTSKGKKIMIWSVVGVAVISAIIIATRLGKKATGYVSSLSGIRTPDEVPQFAITGTTYGDDNKDKISFLFGDLKGVYTRYGPKQANLQPFKGISSIYSLSAETDMDEDYGTIYFTIYKNGQFFKTQTVEI